MTLPSLLELSDVPGCPKVRTALPGPLRAGDRVRLTFRLKRQNGPRSEVLDVSGEFRVGNVVLSADSQHLSVESVGKAPAWKAVRREAQHERVLPPARFDRTTVL